MRVRRVCTCCLLFLLIIAAGAWASANRGPAGRGKQLSARHGSRHVRPDRARKVRVHRLKTKKASSSVSAKKVSSSVSAKTVSSSVSAKTVSSSVSAKTATLAAGDPVLFGDQTVESTHDSNPAGNPQAFAVANSTNGTTASISVYVDSGSAMSKLYAGLYTDNNGHPGSLLVSGSLASPKADAWNSITVPSAAVSSGKTYWLAILGTGSAARFRDRFNGPCVAETASQGGLSSLPSTWSTGQRWNGYCPISAYVNGYLTTSPPAPPSNTGMPAVSGTTTQGQTLSTGNGIWSGSPTGYSYQWKNCDSSGNACTNISGATSSSYQLAASDVGHTMRAVVTATNSGGSTLSTSSPTNVVRGLPVAPPSNTGPPAVSGTATQGQMLSTSNGTWSGSPTGYSYQWKNCDSSGNACTNISGASSSSYQLAASDVGHTMRAVVTATNAGGSASATANATGAVARAPADGDLHVLAQQPSDRTGRPFGRGWVELLRHPVHVHLGG